MLRSALTAFNLLIVFTSTAISANDDPDSPTLYGDEIQDFGINQRSWGALEISPNAYLSAIYRGTFRISVYKNQAVTPDSLQYYYSPALIIDPTSAATSYNSFSKRFEMTFSVIMWDEEFEEFIIQEITRKVGSPVPRSSVRVLPIEQIRIEASEPSADYELSNKWTSYASQPALFQFRFNCVKNETCAELEKQVKNNPNHLVSDTVVYYSLQTQKSTRRTIQVTSEHVQSGSLFSALDQMFPDQDIVYLQSDDVKQLTLEIATNVMATEVTDDEFVSSDQSLSISSLLVNLLKIRTVSTTSFEAQMWDSVFWHDDNSRPDKITQSLNEVYNKSDSTLKEIIKNGMTSASTDNYSTSDGTNFSLGSFSAGGNSAASQSSSLNSMSQLDKEKLVELLNEAKVTSQWNGEVFVPRPMQLSRTNLAALRTSAVITTTQVRVTKTSSELSSRMNVMDSSATVGEVMHQRDQIRSLEENLANVWWKFSALEKSGQLAATGTIAAYYHIPGASNELPDGWKQCNGWPVDCELFPKLCYLTGGNLPDLRERFPIGQMPGGSAFDIYGRDDYQLGTMGKQGGEKKHRLSEREVLASNSIGISHPHNNMPPYFVVKFMIKT